MSYVFSKALSKDDGGDHRKQCLNLPHKIPPPVSMKPARIPPPVKAKPYSRSQSVDMTAVAFNGLRNISSKLKFCSFVFLQPFSKLGFSDFSFKNKLGVVKIILLRNVFGCLFNFFSIQKCIFKAIGDRNWFPIKIWARRFFPLYVHQLYLTKFLFFREVSGLDTCWWQRMERFCHA